MPILSPSGIQFFIGDLVNEVLLRTENRTNDSTKSCSIIKRATYLQSASRSQIAAREESLVRFSVSQKNFVNQISNEKLYPARTQNRHLDPLFHNMQFLAYSLINNY